MRINRRELLYILGILRPALARRESLGQRMEFIFTGREVATYNDRICISYPFKTDFSCSVPAEQLYKILSSIKQRGLELSYKEGVVEVASRSTRVKLITTSGAPDVVKTLELGMLEDRWKELPKDFLEGIFLCMFSASRDVSQQFLSCVGVKQNVIVSSDDLRISYFEMERGMSEEFLLPVASVAELVKLEVDRYYLGDSWVYFCTPEGVVFCSRIVEGGFPDYLHYFDFEGSELHLPEALSDSVGIVSILAEGDFDIDKKISVIVSEGEVTCQGENTLGSIVDIVRTSIDVGDTKEVKFVINPFFFSEILKRTRSMFCGEGRVSFQVGKFKHLMLLFTEEKV